MRADRVRRAAALLRERAEAATPGPWDVDGQGPGPESRNMGCGVVFTMHESVLGGDIASPAGDMYPRGGYSPDHDMTFIATADPTFVLAVAAMLEQFSRFFEAVDYCGDPECQDCAWLRPALDVVDSVLGPEAS